MTLRIAILLLVVVTLAVGCGDSPETLTLDVYFREVDGIFSAIDRDADAIGLGPTVLWETSEEREAFLADESNLPVLKNLFSYTTPRIRILGVAIERLKALEPPTEMEIAHDDVVKAGEDLKVRFEEIEDGVQETGTIAELMALDVSPTVARDAFTEACLNLVGMGRDSGISVAVGCGSII